VDFPGHLGITYFTFTQNTNRFDRLLIKSIYMKKKYAIYFATLVLSAVLQRTWSQSQQHVWYFGDQQIDFSDGVEPVKSFLPNMGNSVPQYFSDGIHNFNNEMLFSFSDGQLHDRNGYYVDDIPDDFFQDPPPMIVPFPGSQCKYFLFSTNCGNGTSTTTVKLIDLEQTGSPIISTVTSFSGTQVNYRNIAVSRENMNQERFIYLVDANNHNIPITLKVYKISNLGVISSVSSTNLSNLSMTSSSIFYEVELSFAGDQLCFVNGTNNISRVQINPENGEIEGYENYQLNGYSGVKSIEFSANGERLYFTSYNELNEYFISYTDFNSEDNVSMSSGYSFTDAHLELTYLNNNQTLACLTTDNQLFFIDDIELTPSLRPNVIIQIPSGHDGVTDFVHLPKQIDGEDYSARFINTDDCCPIYVNTNQRVNLISSNTVWENSLYSNFADVWRIQPGVTLTIQNSTIKFEDYAKIIVSPGAKLKLDNTILTSSSCGTMWDGIVLEGNANFAQTPISQGTVEMINQSVIENALTGIRVYGLNSNGSTDWSKTGGIVSAQNSAFLNNYRDVEFLSYKHENFSLFEKCQFKTNAQLLNSSTLKWHVSMYDVSGIKYLGCEFSNEQANIPFMERGGGIKSVDAGYIVSGLCESIGNYGTPCQDMTYSQFTNLAFGIDGTNPGVLQTIDISYSAFDKVFRGIQMYKVDLVNIHDNILHLDNNQNTTGINLNRCSQYNVSGNEFEGLDDLSITTNGIYIINSNQDGFLTFDNEIYRNTFNKVTHGIRAHGYNGSLPATPAFPIGEHGLTFKCNRFVNGVNSDIYSSGLIKSQQGNCLTISGLSDLSPASNLFSNSSTLVADFWHEGTQQIDYCYKPFTDLNNHSVPSIGLFNALNTQINSCDQLPSFNFNTYCPQLRFDLVQKPLKQLQLDLIEIADQIRDSINGGDKEAILLLIENADPMVVNAQLNPLAGKLTPDVLLAVLNEAPRIPYGMIKDILLLNTPLNEELKNAVLNSEMPAYLKSSLIIPTGKCQVDVLLGTMYEYEKEAALVGNEILRKIIRDTTIVNSLDSLERALNENAMNNSNRIQLVDVNMKMKNYVAVDSILTILELENGFESYCQLQRLFLQLESIPGHCMAAKTDSTIMGQLSGLSNLDPNSLESQVATKLIEFAMEINAFDEIPAVVYTRSAMATKETTSLDEFCGLSIFPNPSADFISFNLGLEDQDKAQIKIVNMGGQVVYEEEIGSDKSTIDIRSLRNGMYVLKVVYPNDLQLESQFTKY
jgi:hypothetical protein